jgi:hypothetical protein
MSEAEGALQRKALMSGMPYSTLLNVYRRGIGAFKTNPESPAAKGVKSKEQWAFGRVNAFIEKRPSVYRGADDDLRRKAGLK